MPHLTRAAIVLACCLAPCTGASAAVLVTRPVSVQAVTPDSVTLVWRTATPSTARVEYGPTLEYGSSAESKLPTTDHALTLHRLTPGTEYFYRVLCGGEIVYAGPEYRFRTVPDKRTARFRFLVFGDSGKGGPVQESLVPGLLAAEPDFVLHTGDVVYPAGEPQDFDPKYFVPYADLLRRTPVWLALGNHDMMTDNGAPYLDSFLLPRNPAGNERYYSFNYGSAHIVVLDSNGAFGPDLVSWLHDDLERATTAWKFVVMHHPMYSCGMHGSDYELRNLLGPIFEQHGVDLVFAGHDHDYQRSHPMRNGDPIDVEQAPNFRQPRGVLYIVTGGGASPRTTSAKCRFTARAIAATHFTQVDVDGAQLALRAVDPDGQVLDEITIDKSAAPAPQAQAGSSGRAEFLESVPNPFNPSTVLRYRLRYPAAVQLGVFDLAGREIRRLTAGVQAAGEHQLVWDGRDAAGRAVASGVYLVRLQLGPDALTRKLVLAK
jgi:hypothetical protein